MQLALLALSVLTILALGYRLYGRLVSRHYALDPRAVTPALRHNDGVDAVTCGVPLALVLSSGPGSYQKFWTLFGTSNQLLAGLSLLGVTVWLKRTGRRYWFVAWPAAFVFGVTLSALVMQAATHPGAGEGLLALLNGFLGLGLLVLALAFILMAGRRLLAPSDQLQGSSSAAS